MTAAPTEAALPRSASGPVIAIALFVAGIALLARVVLSLFPDLPATWRDEVLFAQPPVELLRHGKLATPLLADVLPGVEERTYWMPPLYFLVLAAAFAIAGPGLAVMRAVSLVSACVVLALTYFIGRRCGLGRTTALIPLGALAIDPVFVRGALFGRMDMLTLSLMLGAALLVGAGAGRRWLDPRLLSGAVAGLAFLAHPFGIAAATVFPAQRVRQGASYDLRRPLLGYLAVLIPWLIYVIQDLADFREQLVPQLVSKGRLSGLSGVGRIEQNVLEVIWQYPDMPWRPVILLAIVVAFLTLTARAGRRPEVAPYAVLLVAALTLEAFAPGFWYALYLVPLTYVGLVVAVTSVAGSRARGVRSALAAVILVLLAIENGPAVNDLIDVNGGPSAQRSALATWTAQVSEALPSGSRVLVFADPDPSFVLLKRDDLRVAWLFDEASVLPRYEAIMDRFDYLLLAGSPEFVSRTLAQEHGREVLVIAQRPIRPQGECFLASGPMCPFVAHLYAIKR